MLHAGKVFQRIPPSIPPFSRLSLRDDDAFSRRLLLPRRADDSPPFTPAGCAASAGSTIKDVRTVFHLYNRNKNVLVVYQDSCKRSPTLVAMLQANGITYTSIPLPFSFPRLSLLEDAR